MTITQIKPIHQSPDGSMTWMYRTQETEDRRYYYCANKEQNTTQIYSWYHEWLTYGADQEPNLRYENHTLPMYLPVDPDNPEEAVHAFWRIKIVE